MSARPNSRHTVYTTPLPRKLGIREGSRVALRNAPAAVELRGVEAAGEPPWDVLVAFFTERRALAGELPRLQAEMDPAGGLWVAWPKRASRMPTDMTEDVVREVALPSGWVDNKVCAIDASWSGLRLVLRRELRPPAG